MGVLKPGTHRRILAVDTGCDGRLSIPYFILRGKKAGPTLFFSAGEHGIELNGVGSIQSFIHNFDPDKVSGTLIMVPIITPPNVRYRHLINNAPRDHSYTFDMAYNTYMRWGGRPDGDPADRICHAIATKLLPGVECVLNFHAWASLSSTAGFPGGNPAVKDELNLGRRLGIPFFHEIGSDKYTPAASQLATYASYVLKVPGFLVEIHTQWAIRYEGREIGLRVIRNVCRYFNAMKGTMEANPGGQCNMGVHSEALIRAPFAGLYIPHKPIERMVRKGEHLGSLFDTFTGRTKDLFSPCDGYLWLNHRFAQSPDVQLTGLHAYADKGDLLVLIKKKQE